LSPGDPARWGITRGPHLLLVTGRTTRRQRTAGGTVLYLADQGRSCVVTLESLDPQSPWARLQADAAAGPFAAPYAVHADPSLLVVADAGNDRVVGMDLDSGGCWVPEPSAAVGPLREPRGVTVDGDLLVVADTGSRRVVTGSMGSGDPWTTFGRASVSGSAGPGDFVAPVAVLVDAHRRILVADPGLSRLVRVDDTSGSGWTEITLPAGSRPYGLAHGPDGTVLVTDQAGARVLALADDDTVSVIVDGRPDRRLVAPVAGVLHDGDVVVADAATASLTRWSDGGGAWTFAERLRGDPGPTGGPEFSRLCGLAAGGA
jgi:DNA-binding beta-propeller fold protein YncE